MTRLVVGSEEWCSLPELGLGLIKARIDSGAKTSSLHAFNIEIKEESGGSFCYFDIHPVQKNARIVKRCKAPLIGRRSIKSSNGLSEMRYVIQTTVEFGTLSWPIEITLTNRDAMGYRMLIGRQAMEGRILVDPSTRLCLNDYDEKHVLQLYSGCVIEGKTLKIALLASDPKLYSNERIIEAGIERGHHMEFIPVTSSYIGVNSQGPELYGRGGLSLSGFDAVIPRLRPSATFYGCAILRQFQSLGVFCLNDAKSIRISRDKLHALQILARKGIAMPRTGFANSPEDTKEVIAMVGGAPVVIKLLEGTKGTGVVLAETNKAAESVINAFKTVKANILVQEFIKEAEGKDIRCFVIDGKVVAAMERTAQEGEFRANIHLGASAKTIKLSPQERKLAISAAACLGLHVAGVDLIRSKQGPLVLEVNSAPGLEGIEKATGLDIGSMLIQSVEKGISAKK